MFQGENNELSNEIDYKLQFLSKLKKNTKFLKKLNIFE